MRRTAHKSKQLRHAHDQLLLGAVISITRRPGPTCGGPASKLSEATGGGLAGLSAPVPTRVRYRWAVRLEAQLLLLLGSNLLRGFLCRGFLYGLLCSFRHGDIPSASLDDVRIISNKSTMNKFNLNVDREMQNGGEKPRVYPSCVAPRPQNCLILTWHSTWTVTLPTKKCSARSAR